MRWPMMLSSKGSWSTCILQGLSTFLHTAFTAHTDEAIEGHGGEMVEDRAQLQTEAAVCSQQGIAGHFRSHLTIAQDEMGEDREHRSACRALATPDGDATQADPDIMRVTGQAPAPATGRLVGELQAKGQHEGEDTLAKRLAVSQQADIGGFVAKIHGDRAVFAGPF